jgi:hypothetical protein
MASPCCASPESRTAVLAARLSDERERGEVVEEVKVKKMRERERGRDGIERIRRRRFTLLTLFFPLFLLSCDWGF